MQGKYHIWHRSLVAKVLCGDTFLSLGRESIAGEKADAAL